MVLAFNLEGTDVAERFNAMGVSAFVLKYRVPQRPAQPGVKGRETFGWAPLQDAQRAMGIVRQRAAEWKIDPTKVGFNGFSAGGHLTVHLTTSWGERTYPRVDAADDLPCRPDYSLPIYPWKLLLNNDPSSMQLAPEVSNVSASTPPVMIAQNEDDPSAHVENSLVFYYQLKRSKGRQPSSALHLYPTGGHGFGLCQSSTEFKECCDWPLAAQRFMQDLGFAPNVPKTPCTGVYQANGSFECHPTA
jgi:acetyl esterase/lipase